MGEEYDAWTNEGILEAYWGEHIHLGALRRTCTASLAAPQASDYRICRMWRSNS